MKNKRKYQIGPFLLLSLLCSTAACTGEHFAGNGNLEISISGGASVREGFPHREGNANYVFSDGWSLQYTRYFVSIGNILLESPGGGEEIARWDDSVVLELKSSPTAGRVITTLKDVPALRHNFEFEFLPVNEDTDPGNTDSESFELMKNKGWSFLAEGRAVHELHGSVDFSIGLPISTNYYSCINGIDMTEGVAVEADKTTGVFIYSHAIHMFWTTLATGDEALRFEAFAAMQDKDGFVSEEYLLEQDLNDLIGMDGNPLRDESNNPVFYNDNGRLRPGEQTLYHFILEAMRDSAHFNGVGLCRMRSLQ